MASSLCILPQNTMISVCSKEVKACFTPVSFAINLPARCFLSDPKRWKSLDPVLPAEIVRGYSAMAGRLYTTLTTVLILLPVISIAMDKACNKHLSGK